MKQDFYEARNSVYCYDNTDILINNFNLKDSKTLAELERQIVFAKLYELRQNDGFGNFDIIHFLRNT